MTSSLADYSYNKMWPSLIINKTQACKSIYISSKVFILLKFIKYWLNKVFLLTNIILPTIF